MSKIKIGVIGAGKLGKYHIQNIVELKEFELIGFVDTNIQRSIEVQNQFQIQPYVSAEQLIACCDALVVAVPTTAHFDVSRLVLRAGKHIFVEKPLADNLQTAMQMVKFADEAQVVAQVGHVERFNPAFTSIINAVNNPMFIETHRLSQWSNRGSDVSVVLDLMIHDLDILLMLIKSNVKKIKANGVAVISKTPDIANARIEFHNGAVANLTASRISVTQMRKMRLFQKNAYISIDFLNKTSEIYKMQTEQVTNMEANFVFETEETKKYLYIEQTGGQEINAIKSELLSFAEAINQKKRATVSFEEGYASVNLAFQIIDLIQNQ